LAVEERMVFDLKQTVLQMLVGFCGFKIKVKLAGIVL
jgi:hypothetical protein